MPMSARVLAAAVLLAAGCTLKGAPGQSGEGLRVAAGSRQLHFRGGEPLRVWVAVQLVDRRTGGAVARRAPLYLTSDHGGIVFPERSRLDGNGFARLGLLIPPPGPGAQERLQGRFTVWVLIDEEDADDTMGAALRFRYTIAAEAPGSG